jgi:hypothetical protein
MFCESGTGVSGDKIRRNFDGERSALPMLPDSGRRLRDCNSLLVRRGFAIQKR